MYKCHQNSHKIIILTRNQNIHKNVKMVKKYFNTGNSRNEKRIN